MGQRCLLTGHFDSNWAPFPFPSLGQPCRQSVREQLRGQAEAGFQRAFGGRKGIVVLGGICKIPHAELVQPFQRAVPAFTLNHHFDMKFLCVHIGHHNTEPAGTFVRLVPIDSRQILVVGQFLVCPSIKRFIRLRFH